MKEKIKNSFLIFIILQPILDVYFLYSEKIIELFGFSPSTIIRFLYIGIVLMYVMYKYKKDKDIFALIGYFFASGIYVILHHLHVANLKTIDPNGFGYSFLGELLYIARLTLSVGIMYITSKFKFTFDELKSVFCKTTFIISSSVVILNLFKIALGSYNNEIIKGNIFSWFTSGYEEFSFLGLASKGWFNFANQISGILMMMLPFVIYEFYKNRTKFNVFNLFFTMLTMVMLGTKVALYGTFLIYVSIIIIYFINKKVYYKKIKIDIVSLAYVIIFTAIYTFLLPHSPAINRQQISNSMTEVDEVEENDKVYKMSEINGMKEQVKKGTKEEKIKFIKKFYGSYKIEKMFIEDGYNYKFDPDFWIDVMDKPLYERLNYRKLEQSMIKKVSDYTEKDNSLFGISYCRVQNIFNIERDYILQYYTIGILGIGIFIIPFIIITIFFIIKMFINYKEELNTKNMIMCLSAVSIQGIAFYSGNIIDSMLCIIYLSFLLGVMIDKIKVMKSGSKSIVGVEKL